MRRYGYLLTLVAALAVPSLFAQQGGPVVVEQNAEMIALLTEIQADVELIAGSSSNGAVCLGNLELSLVTVNLLISVCLGCGVTLALFQVARRG